MNNNEKINVENLRLVSLKYFSEENNGVEYTAPLSYAFLVKVDEETYVNPFAPEDDYPVFEAAPYRNISFKSGWQEYGCKLFQVSGKSESGPCYVSYGEDMEELFGTDTVTLEVLKRYMLRSSNYFKDREQFFREVIKKYSLLTLFNFKKDKEAKMKMLEFFEERGVQLQKVR